MSGHTNWKTLRARDPRYYDPERVARRMAYGQIMDMMLTLAELRERQGVSQSALAQALDVSQSNISQIEHKTDLFLSTVCAYVEALGGDVHIVATFPDGQSVEITPPMREAIAAGSR